MLRRLLVPLAALAVLALAAAAVGNARTTAAHKLIGEVGPGYKIEVTTPADKDVKTTKAGTYTIVIEDKAAIHNFHLVGPGVNKKTGVSFVGKKTWTVTLKPGKYTYQCDPHATLGMKGSFRVTS
jgi:plastocyanin